jgi:hypothetical protein
LSDAVFSDELPIWDGGALARADAKARADLGKANNGSTSLRLEEDGAAIAQNTSAWIYALHSMRLRRLSSSQIADLRLLEQFGTANQRYAVALQNDPGQGAGSARVRARAASAAAADRVVRTAVQATELPLPRAPALPPLSVFTISPASP